MFQKTMLSIVAAGLMSSGAAYAGATASSGFALPYSEQNCFGVEFGAVRNNCTADKQWTVSDYIQVTGNHTILVTGSKPSGGKFDCAACPTTKEGGIGVCTSTFSVPTVGTRTQFSLGTVNVPAYGSLYVVCTLSPGAVFGSASF